VASPRVDDVIETAVLQRGEHIPLASMQETKQAPSMPTSRKVLCTIYAAIAVAALVATWSHAGPCIHSVSAFFVSFWSDTKATQASRFITADILLFGLAAVILMVIEARKYNVRIVWAYIVGGVLIAISVAFPLFLLARELRMNTSEVSSLRTTDTILLIVSGVAILGLTVWVGAG
jgi:Protein of unknown function DUF2834